MRLKSIVAVTSKRELKNKVSKGTLYFIRHLSANNPKKLEHAVRGHWAIENNLQWVLGIAFDDDSNRTHKGYSAVNLAAIRHMVLNLIKQKSAKVGVKNTLGWIE